MRQNSQIRLQHPEPQPFTLALEHPMPHELNFYQIYPKYYSDPNGTIAFVKNNFEVISTPTAAVILTSQNNLQK